MGKSEFWKNWVIEKLLKLKLKKIFKKMEFWNQLENWSIGKFNLKKLANLKVWKNILKNFNFEKTLWASNYSV